MGNCVILASFRKRISYKLVCFIYNEHFKWLIINCLYSSADPVTSFASEMGAGRINAFAAMQCAGNFALDTDAGITEIVQPNGNICSGTFTPQIILRNYFRMNFSKFQSVFFY